MDVKINSILSGAINLKQPVLGYRATIDPILLSASIKTNCGDKVLDVGCGVGTAALSLAHRIKNIEIIGIDIQQPLVTLAQENVQMNKINNVQIMQGDILDKQLRKQLPQFEQIISNPPYFLTECGASSPYENKAQANLATRNLLKQWIINCVGLLKSRGYLTIIFTSRRMDELLAIMHSYLGEMVIFPLWSKQYRESKLFIVRGRKNIKSVAKLKYGITMHQPDGSYTKELNNILKNGEKINL